MSKVRIKDLKLESFMADSNHGENNSFFPDLEKITGGNRPFFQRGFTLIEFLIAIFILSVVIGITFPAIRAYQSSLSLKLAARNLTSDLRLTQQLAVSEQIDYVLCFYLLDNKYEIIQSGDCGSVQSIKESRLPGKVEFNQINFSQSKVIFNPYGSVRESGSVKIINDRNEALTIEVKSSGHITTN